VDEHSELARAAYAAGLSPPLSDCYLKASGFDAFVDFLEHPRCGVEGKDPPKIRFIMNDPVSYNAAAFKLGEVYYIAIDATVAAYAKHAAFSVFRDQGFLPELGDSSSGKKNVVSALACEKPDIYRLEIAPPKLRCPI